MGKIHEMSMELANLISAGEVVNRPANAIKELVENSIDAGATAITVEIQNGGTALMRVSDNGCGMDASDLVLSVRRHATSKLYREEDIDCVTTMGFRGEALASIAAVTKLRIISKTADAEFGHMLSVEYGQNAEIFERGCTTGTTVIAEDLFYNVPVRRKFLKKDVTEAGAVTDAVERLAVSHPEVAFRMMSDGVLKFSTPGNSDLESTVYSVLGKSLRGNLIEVNDFSDGIKITGFIGSPMLAKANRQQQFIYVNRRCVNSPLVSKALSQAYTSYIPEDKYPLCMLFIKVNTRAVDVNVHPSKLEVKFSSDAMIFGAVYRAVANALERIREIPGDVILPKPKVSEMPAPADDEKQAPRKKRQIDLSAVVPEAMLPKYPAEEKTADKKANLPYRTSESETVYVGLSEDSSAFSKEPELPKPRALTPKYGIVPANAVTPPTQDEVAKLVFGEDEMPAKKYTVDESGTPDADYKTASPGETADGCESPAGDSPDGKTTPEKSEEPGNVPGYRYYKIIGELYNKYALVEAVTVDGVCKFIMIDKHAAHERMLFERLKKNYRFDMGAQMLMFPMTINTGALDAVTAKLHSDVLEDYGFKLEADITSITLFSIPNGFDEETAKDILSELLEQLREERAAVSDFLPERMERALFTVACKAAIKGGRTYPPEFLETVVKAVLTDPSIRFCPHGRPVAFEMSLSEIDGRFKR